MKKQIHFLFIVIISLASIVLLNVGYIFFLVALLPSVVAYFVDTEPQKNIYKAVRSANLAGLVPLVFPLVSTRNPSAQLQVQMSDAEVWLQIYGAAAAGWVLLWVCSKTTYLFLLVFGETRVAMLERSQKELVKEWGEAILSQTPY